MRSLNQLSRHMQHAGSMSCSTPALARFWDKIQKSTGVEAWQYLATFSSASTSAYKQDISYRTLPMLVGSAMTVKLDIG